MDVLRRLPTDGTYNKTAPQSFFSFDLKARLFAGGLKRINARCWAIGWLGVE
jgi:hypothetical protein